MSAKKPGRPTKKQEESIHDILTRCFGDGLSAPAAARIAGVDRKTAYSHYDEIVKQHKEKTFENLFEREENDRAQVIATFDKDLEEVSELFSIRLGLICNTSEVTGSVMSRLDHGLIYRSSS